MKKDLKAEFTYHAEYFKIASDNYKIILRLKQKHDAKKDELKNLKDSNVWVDLSAEINAEIERRALIVIVFSALTLEAFINDYAISRISKSYFNKYLDKLDLMAKWIVIPRIITGTQLDTGSESIQNLQWLISMRNKLVHYKTRRIQVDKVKTSDFLWEYDAEKAIKAVDSIVTALKDIDEEANTDWLK